MYDSHTAYDGTSNAKVSEAPSVLLHAAAVKAMKAASLAASDNAMKAVKEISSLTHPRSRNSTECE